MGKREITADYRLIGGRIKEKRKKCGYTQEKLAELLDVSVGYISQVERGTTKISLDFLCAAAAHLSCDPGELAAGSAAGGHTYLQEETLAEYRHLTGREKRLVLEFIRLLLQNREP